MPCCAGAHYGRIVSGKPPFEEVALLLVESGEPEALQVFLQTKLQARIPPLHMTAYTCRCAFSTAQHSTWLSFTPSSPYLHPTSHKANGLVVAFCCAVVLLLCCCCAQVLGPSDKAQSTMVAAWLTELLLDQINRDLLAAAGQHTPEYLQHVEQLRWVHLIRVGALRLCCCDIRASGHGRGLLLSCLCVCMQVLFVVAVLVSSRPVRHMQADVQDRASSSCVCAHARVFSQ